MRNIVRSIALAVSLALTSCAHAEVYSDALLPSPDEPAGQRQIIVISDLHMWRGLIADGVADCTRHDAAAWERMEDFRWCDEFRQFLRKIDKDGRDAGLPTDLIVAGDFLELWQSPDIPCGVAGRRNLGCSEDQALARLEGITAGHAGALAALGWFASQGEDPDGNRLIIVPGNHDAALVFDRVRSRLLTAVPAPTGRVRIAVEGYWLSGDGKIFIEHGHQMKADPSMYPDINRPAYCLSAREGPIDCNSADETAYLQRMGGENFVQSFYNAYEQEFPIIDNLASETLGVRKAVEAWKPDDVVGAVADGLVFLLTEQTVDQAVGFLGDEEDQEGREPQWDYEAVRNKEPAFFLATLPTDSGLRRFAEKAFESEERRRQLRDMTTYDIDTLCTVRQALIEKARKETENLDERDHRLRQLKPCPQLSRDGKLGGLFIRAITTDSQILSDHVKARQQALPSERGKNFQYFIFGHTHRAFRKCAIGSGPERTLFVNSGAWQRVASEDQLANSESFDFSDKDALATLSPEDLPACYTHVRVRPATRNAELDVELRFWASRTGRDDWFDADECPYLGSRKSVLPPKGCVPVN